MDAQSRGHAGNVDPADQWVFNPETGSYELQLTPAVGGAPETATPASASRTSPPRQRTPSAPESRYRVPPQREGADREGTPPGRRGRPPAGGSRRRSRSKPSGKQKSLRWAGGAVALLMVAGCTGVYFVYQHFNGNIDQVDVGIDNAATTDGPVNILLIGTDSRSGEGNKGYGDTGSVGHADTTLLFHVAEDRSNATVLSIPRDLITDIPDCPTSQEDGSTETIPGEQRVRFNTSLGQQGRDPGCTWRTVEELTGIKINHFMMADFNAVKTLSTAIGGVEVCLAKDIDDPKSHLQLAAGRHTLQGEDALAFVRTRKSVGFGSDLSRIKLQQQFLSSMIRKMKSGDTLTNPQKLWKLGEAVTDALTVDSEIGSVKDLIGLAKDLRQVNPKNVTFVTLPVLDNPNETTASTVVLDEAKARPLFRMIQADNSLTKRQDSKKNKKKKEPVAQVPASEVRVDVLNGGDKLGAAQETVDWLQNDHGVYLSTNAGNAPADQAQTTLEFGSDQAGQAAALADLMGLPDSALKKQTTAAGPDTPMTLTLGGDFTAPGTPITPPTKAPADIDSINGGNKNICAK